MNYSPEYININNETNITFGQFIVKNNTHCVNNTITENNRAINSIVKRLNKYRRLKINF